MQHNTSILFVNHSLSVQVMETTQVVEGVTHKQMTVRDSPTNCVTLSFLLNLSLSFLFYKMKIKVPSERY